jgi:hypothetical protein
LWLECHGLSTPGTFFVNRVRGVVMEDTSVIITTAARPQMLARALRSVRCQTARDRVAEVVVIENGSSRDSQTVCADFADLPIRYVFNVPPRPLEQYLKTTFIQSAPRGAFVALLHDDDVWMEHHVAQGLRALSIHAKAAACYTGALVVGDKGPELIFGAFFPWLVTGFGIDAASVVLDPAQALMANVFSTSFHYSTLFARTVAITRAVSDGPSTNPYDSDRLLVLLLTSQGSIAYAPPPSAWIYRHSGQDSVHKGKTAEALGWWESTNGRFAAQLAKHGVTPDRELARLMDERGVSLAEVLPFQTHSSVTNCMSPGDPDRSAAEPEGPPDGTSRGAPSPSTTAPAESPAARWKGRWRRRLGRVLNRWAYGRRES